ncbi:MAG: hypothetical protein JWR80_4702 [Bradyrhizobium sp.]|nr:hypothetical protein [Bradyrhizobium sp.]
MTTAEFIAACFWPLAGLFALLLAGVRDPALRRYVVKAAAGFAILYFGLWVFDPQSSIIAMVDFYILFGLLGLAALGHGTIKWRQDRYYGFPIASKETLTVIGSFLVGALLVGVSGTTLFSDFAQPRLILEGRALDARSSGRRSTGYRVNIAGRTVKATTPDYERLKLKPYVRVEVGRGSDYIYRIEYLAN